MRTGEKATPNGSGKTNRATDEVNAAQATATGAPAPATRQEPATDTKRPWAVRKPDGPSWAEKVEQF